MGHKTIHLVASIRSYFHCTMVIFVVFICCFVHHINRILINKKYYFIIIRLEHCNCACCTIVKLRQGSGKVRQGKARKGKDGER